MVLAQGRVATELRELGRTILDAFEHERFDYVWQDLTTLSAQHLISTIIFPISYLDHQDIDWTLQAEHIHGIALGFQLDHEGQRTGFFRGMTSSIEDMGWYEFDPAKIEQSMVFVDSDAAVLIADATPKHLILPLSCLSSRIRMALGSWISKPTRHSRCSSLLKSCSRLAPEH